MELSRRKLLSLGISSMALLAFGKLHAAAKGASSAIEKITNGGSVGEGKIDLIAPEIAENGNSVPIEFSAPGATSVTILADGNPDAVVATFNFGKLNPTRSASTRVRLSQTQNVIVLAKMEDGSFQKAQANIKVTIGGCGG
jgi:sulfur-oxidizing protein SoxY